MYSTQPRLVLGLAGQQIGVRRQRRGGQIQKVVADDVGVFLVVREELLERRFAVLGVEALDVERIADPVERRGLPQHRPAAAVLHAADDLVDAGRSWAPRDPRPCRSPANRRARSWYFASVGIDRPMRLKSCSPSPWCIQSDWTMNSLWYMPCRAIGTSVVLASVYCLIRPS